LHYNISPAGGLSIHRPKKFSSCFLQILLFTGNRPGIQLFIFIITPGLPGFGSSFRVGPVACFLAQAIRSLAPLLFARCFIIAIFVFTGQLLFLFIKTVASKYSAERKDESAANLIY
jgi:hypothetical protein